ncbi:hypothetical protein ASD54_12280 [Rhizobium sp. Root149]|uniref:beta strand repeat-containing protein n=1 Tax=Rhizobium sp. Root149 TaxID=1736473 RepID=UPI000715759C|nr:hypothetical protein [Rhizobium sp. Root149]KQZ49709.1 hypothetical protein ASD54_12280 [Rhizobium sp. Root149]
MANNLGISDYTVGGDYDSWGDKIIADLARLNKAAGDVLTITTATGTVTLTQDQSNNAVHRLTATLTGNVIVETLAGLSRYWIVRNATSGAFSVTYRVAGGVGASVSITQGRTAIVWSDGVDCSIFDLSTLSGLVTTAQITDANVTTAKLADAAVTTVKIADSNVTTAKLADAGVTTAKLADSNVTTAKIADSAVTTAKIADSNVTAAKLASGAALSNLATNSVTKAKLEQIASYRVLGNLTGSLANVDEVTVSNDPTMAAGSQTSLVTEYAARSLITSTAFSSALPAQTGNARKIPTTDGTNASWTFPAFDADIFRVRDNTDQTKQVAFAVSGVSTGTTRTLTIPNQSGTLALTSDLPQAGQRNFTATGTLPNGATVVLNSDGTVSTVTANNDTTGTATVFRSASTTWIASAALSATQVVVCYYDGTNSQAVIGTISGTSVSFGTAVTFRSGGGGYVSVCALSSTSFAVAYRDTGNQGNARIGSVSGTAITFPSAEVTFNPASTAFISIASLSSTAVIIAYQDTGNSSYGTAIIGTVSGTTITFGSEYVFRPLTTSNISVCALTSSTIVVANDASGAAGQCYAGTVSGTAITFGSLTTFDSTAAASYTSIVALTSTSFLVAWARGTTDGRAKIGTVSGTTVSFPGSDAVFNGNTGYVSATKLSATSVLVAYEDAGNSSYGTICIATISGSTITFGSEIVFRSATATYHAASALSSSYIFVGYRDGGNSNYGTGVVFQPAATNVANWIGITAAAIANGASGPVTILGGVNTSLSGLTTKATYYYANDGTLTTTVTSYKAGKALSSGSLLITGSAQ